MKASEIRGLPAEEINTEIRKARAKLFKFRFHTGDEEMHRAGEIRNLRRQIARMMTVLRERELKEAN